MAHFGTRVRAGGNIAAAIAFDAADSACFERMDATKMAVKCYKIGEKTINVEKLPKLAIDRTGATASPGCPEFAAKDRQKIQ